MDIFTPNIPMQPTALVYGLAALQVLPRLTRAIYKEKAGEQAPPWDQAKPIKRWADHTASASAQKGGVPYVYTSYVVDKGKVVARRYTMSGAEARAVNLPGQYDYPKWDPPEVRGYVYSEVDGTQSNISRWWVAGQTEADALREELGAVEIAETTLNAGGPYRYVYEPGETRRVWNVILKSGRVVNVGHLLRLRYREGVGSPGKWEAKTTSPRWIPAKFEGPGEYDPRPEIPIPCRALLPNETPKVGFGGIIQIVKTGSTGGEGEADWEMVARIDRNVQALKKELVDRRNLSN